MTEPTAEIHFNLYEPVRGLSFKLARPVSKQNLHHTSIANSPCGN